LRFEPTSCRPFEKATGVCIGAMSPDVVAVAVNPSWTDLALTPARRSIPQRDGEGLLYGVALTGNGGRTLSSQRALSI
jgi:hypothetical protein